MTPADLKALLDAATPGPWEAEDGDIHGGTQGPLPRYVCETGFGFGSLRSNEDVRLCAALRNLGPLLIELWEAAEGTLIRKVALDHVEAYAEVDRIESSAHRVVAALRALREARP